MIKANHKILSKVPQPCLFYIFTHSTLTTTLQGRCYYYHPYIIDEEIEELMLLAQGQKTIKRESRDSYVDSLASEAMPLY